MVGIQQEGLDLTTRRLLGKRLKCAVRAVAVALATGLAALAAIGQEPQVVPDGDILADISTTFITAYKPGAWVPIDVMIHNNKKDIRGHMEVTVFTPSGPASPVYRVPVDSAKGSRKRFRVYCRMVGATSLRVMVYDKGRPALDLPLSVDLQPLDERDRIGLILDDAPEDYAFIYTAIQRSAGNTGLHRHNLRTPDLPQLPDRPPCYEAYNLVVLGQIDPAQIGLRQRELLKRYVRQGGVLVICTGENAGRFRGTWVEELAGAGFGAQLTVDEQTLAAEVFAPDEQSGGRLGNSVLLTEITRGAVETECLGLGRVLAARRPLGSGYVVTLAVDAHGKALQNCDGYLRLWNDLSEHHGIRTSLDYASAASTASQTLPSATGVKVYPWTSVLAYLLLYFFVGIIANWLFWSWFKRREMAWVCLIFFSIGFTAYALIYGTAGRAKATEIAQLEVFRVPADGSTGERQSVIGLLSARTARYDFKLNHEYGLVSDSWNQTFSPFMSGRRGFLGQSDAFTFLYDSPPHIENLRVGASVMRVFEVASDFEPKGAVEGDLVWDDEGLHGTLSNQSGFALENPFLLIEGRRIGLPDGDTMHVDVSPERLAQPDYLFDTAQPGYFYYGYSQIDRNTLRQRFLDDLISRSEFEEAIDPQLGPFLCGWIAGPTPDVVRADEPMQQQISHALLVADIHVNRSKATQPARIALEMLANERSVAMREPWRTGLRQRMLEFYGAASSMVEAVLPPDWEGIQGGELVIEIWHFTNNNATVVFAPLDSTGNEVPPGNPGFRRMEAGQSDSEESGIFGPISNWRVVSTPDGNASVATFRFPDWKDYVDRERDWIKGSVRLVNPDGDNRQVYGSFLPQASLVVPRQAATDGDWHPWQ
jgi:hypothetical protein